MTRERYWDEPEVVEKFARRPPDQRLVQLLDADEDPSRLRVLDVGCAGGRNTELLAQRGCNVWAMDPSPAMVERTTARLAAIPDFDDAKDRVVCAPMHELATAFAGLPAPAAFDWMIALGVLHMSRSQREWDVALRQLVSRLEVGGLLLVAIFTPRTDLTGLGVSPVAGEQHVYEGFPSGRAFVLEQEALEAELERFGCSPQVRSRTVEVKTEKGRRVTVNALFRKRA